MNKSASELKNEILALTREYAQISHSAFRPALDPLRQPWKPGDSIPYAGRVFTEEDVVAAAESVLDFWLTLGKNGDVLQHELKSFLGIHSVLLVNSGSSANLLAISCLTSPLLSDDRQLKPGDEIITCAAGFPTTVSPILQNNCVPVFLDCSTQTCNIDVTQLEAAFCKGKTKAVMIAHALGNPFNLLEIIKFCQKYNLWLIEDNCDSLGSTYSLREDIANDLGFYHNSPGVTKTPGYITRWTGTWGDISTQSFYPPHHLTMGEGGSVNIVSNPLLKKIVESFRDWGRDCWCPSGHDNSCKKRYDWKLGELPEGFDHKYIYSHLGYNLKPLDLQAAIGIQQLKKLPHFIQSRKDNWLKLYKGLKKFDAFLDFSLPTHAKEINSDGNIVWDEDQAFTDCSWFGFLIRVRKEAPFSSRDLARYLESKGIGSRMFFGGNLLRQPVFVNMKSAQPNSIRTLSSGYCSADTIMTSCLFLGTYPGLTPQMIDYEISIISSFISTLA